ncbi:MAG: hypothetical protein RIT09_92 [Pseudomonadota bacterium]|jgi:hypothetical protein
MELKLLRKIIINCYSITFSNIDKVIVTMENALDLIQIEGILFFLER